MTAEPWVSVWIRLPSTWVGRPWKLQVSEVDNWVHAGNAGEEVGIEERTRKTK